MATPARCDLRWWIAATPLIFAALFVVTSCSSGDGGSLAAAGTSGAQGESNATVERVVDGDTIIADIGGSTERIRLIGIDTPESVKENSPVECFGVEASDQLKQLLPEGSPITVVRDVEARDRFDRLLGYIYRSKDSLFINRQMLADGFAEPFNFEPNSAFRDEFRQVSNDARNENLGMWGSC